MPNSLFLVHTSRHFSSMYSSTKILVLESDEYLRNYASSENLIHISQKWAYFSKITFRSVPWVEWNVLESGLFCGGGSYENTMKSKIHYGNGGKKILCAIKKIFVATNRVLICVAEVAWLPWPHKLSLWQRLFFWGREGCFDLPFFCGWYDRYGESQRK